MVIDLRSSMYIYLVERENKLKLKYNTLKIKNGFDENFNLIKSYDQFMQNKFLLIQNIQNIIFLRYTPYLIDSFKKLKKLVFIIYQFLPLKKQQKYLEIMKNSIQRDQIPYLIHLDQFQIYPFNFRIIVKVLNKNQMRKLTNQIQNWLNQRNNMIHIQPIYKQVKNVSSLCFASRILNKLRQYSTPPQKSSFILQIISQSYDFRYTSSFYLYLRNKVTQSIRIFINRGIIDKKLNILEEVEQKDLHKVFFYSNKTQTKKVIEVTISSNKIDEEEYDQYLNLKNKKDLFEQLLQ